MGGDGGGDRMGLEGGKGKMGGEWKGLRIGGYGGKKEKMCGDGDRGGE